MLYVVYVKLKCIDKVKGKSFNEFRIYYKYLRFLSYDGGKLEVYIYYLINMYIKVCCYFCYSFLY